MPIIPFSAVLVAAYIDEKINTPVKTTNLVTTKEGNTYVVGSNVPVGEPDHVSEADTAKSLAGWAADDEITAQRADDNAAERLFDANNVLDNLLDQYNTAIEQAKIQDQIMAVSPAEGFVEGGQSSSMPTFWDDEVKLLEDAIAEQQLKIENLADVAFAAENAATAAAAAHVLAAEEAAKTQLEPFSGKLEGAAARKRLLAQQQCFLLYNNHFFVKKHKNLLSGGLRTKDTNKPVGAYNKFSNSKLPKGGVQTSPGYYSSVTETTKIILIDDSDEANDSTIINKLKIKDKQEEFDKITPAEYAQLLPTIRLFKVNYDKGKSSQHKIEFKFNNKINVEDIGAVNQTFEGNIRGDGAGVTSFEWSYLGTDSFTATRDLKATLKLNFQSFGELKKDRESDFKIDGKKVKYRYLDLVIQPNCKDETNEVVYDPGCYEILAEVGYAAPTLHGTLSENMREAINSSKEQLYLVMTDHSFEFEQDGTFSMTINYRARLGSQLASRKFNVLLPAGGNDPGGVQWKIKNMKKEIADLKESNEEDADPAGDQDNSDLKDKQEKLDEYLGQQRIKFYNIVYSSLRNRRWIHGTQIPKGDELKYLNYDQKIEKVTKKKIKGGAGVDQFIGLPETLKSDHPIWYDMESAVKTWDDMMDTSGNVTAPDAATAAQESRLDRLVKQYETEKNEPVRFVYLGDIIAVVNDWIMGEEKFGHTNYDQNTIASSEKNSLGIPLDWSFLKSGELDTSTNTVNDAQQVAKIRESFHIILGNVEMKDFSPSGETRLVNMAHIPISLDAFLDFMTRNVVAKKRQVYLFSSFINDLLVDLVMRNLSTKCFGGLVSGAVRTAVSMLEIPSHHSGKEPIAGTGGNQLFKPGMPLNRCCVFHPRIIGTGPEGEKVFLNKTPPVAKSGKAGNTFDYLLINSKSTKPKLYGVWDVVDFAKKHGADVECFDKIGDKIRGIPHYTFGQNVGILKTVKFAKTDQEFLPEARYEQEGSNAINQLAAVYDVTFEMLGTARFQPGQYIYFDPVTMGVGKPWQTPSKGKERSYANLMGLGGYHLVTEVASNIQRGEFSTTLKTRWTTSGCHPIRGCPK